MKLLSLGKGKKESFLLLVLREEEGEPLRLTVTEAEYRALGSPKEGCELDSMLAVQLMAADEAHRATAAAARILAFGDNTAAMLGTKLRRRGFSASVAEATVRKMVERGYIREGDLLYRSVLLCARKLWGPRRITDALAARGFRREEIASVIDRLVRGGELDFAASRKKLLEKSGGELSPQKKKALLYRFGYRVGGEDE